MLGIFALYAGQLDNIQMVLTDLMMPFMGGTELVRTLLRLNPGLKVLLTSGMEEEEGLAADRLKEEFLFLAKPYSKEDLLKMAEAALRGA